MSVKHVNSDNFKEVVLQSKEPVLVDIWAPWCGPCKMLGPIIDEVAEKANGFQVVKIDVDENQDIALQYKVRSVPTLLVFKNGEVVNRSVGLISKESVLELLE